jgi:GT2 family glycosyltransferase
VVVVIDGSDDGTREMVASFDAPYALLGLWQPNRGCAAARNAGLHQTRGEIVVLMDDDMEPSEEMLEAHLRAHEGEPSIGVLGAVPIATGPSTPPIVRYVAEKFDRHLAGLAEGRRIGFRSFYTGNFSIRRQTLDRVGLFDETFTEYGNEDSELALRLLRAGVRMCYCAGALARQHYEKDFPAVARDYEAKGRTAVHCARKHPEAAEHLQRKLYTGVSRKARVARTMLVALSGRARTLPRLVVRVTAWLERGPRRAGLGRWYRLVLDYFYCLGARAALREGRDGRTLARKAGAPPLHEAIARHPS